MRSLLYYRFVLSYRRRSASGEFPAARFVMRERWSVAITEPSIYLPCYDSTEQQKARRWPRNLEKLRALRHGFSISAIADRSISAGWRRTKRSHCTKRGRQCGTMRVSDSGIKPPARGRNNGMSRPHPEAQSSKDLGGSWRRRRRRCMRQQIISREICLNHVTSRYCRSQETLIARGPQDAVSEERNLCEERVVVIRRVGREQREKTRRPDKAKGMSKRKL